MTADPMRPSRATKQEPRLAAGAVEEPAGARRRDRQEPVVCWCSEQGVLWWTRRLLLRRMHPWPHQDGVSLGIVEGGPCRGAPTIVTVVIAGAVFLDFPLTLALTLAFAAVVAVGGKRGRGRQRTRQFLLWWARRQLLLQRAPST
jgi:hypothetical protein